MVFQNLLTVFGSTRTESGSVGIAPTVGLGTVPLGPRRLRTGSFWGASLWALACGAAAAIFACDGADAARLTTARSATASATAPTPPSGVRGFAFAWEACHEACAGSQKRPYLATQKNAFFFFYRRISKIDGYYSGNGSKMIPK